MACCLVALDKRPGVRPVGIGETLRQALAKLVMRAAGDEAKKACGNIHLCAGATHAVGQRRQARVRAIRKATEEEEAPEAEEEEEGVGIAEFLHNLNIETGVTEEEAAEGMAEALGMEVKEEGASEGE